MMHNPWWSVLVAVGLTASNPVSSQMRAGQPPVLERPSQPEPPPPDVLGTFKGEYKTAGEPRVLLFWNVAFDDETEIGHEEVTYVKRSTSASLNDLNKQTQGPVGAATLRENDSKSIDREEHVKTTLEADPAKVHSNLDLRNEAQLEVDFRQQLHAAGVRLLDRSTVMRFTQARLDRGHIDPKLIESDAVLGKADLLLEVLMIPDPAAPLGAGFKITATNIKDGAEILTFYTLGRPIQAVPAGHYVATDHGFAWQQPQIPRPNVSDVAITLASQVLRKVGAALPVRTTPP
jgi:hypothetical protein